MATPGLFIALEGVDGSGKTGAQRFLADALTARGMSIVATREPGGTDEGMALRSLLLSESDRVWQPKAELLLMVGARIQHVARVIRPAVAAGKIVLTDRYVGSTLAYQGAGRGLEPGLILGLHRDCVEDYWPDLTLLLDVDPRLGLARSRQRLVSDAVDEGRFEALDVAFHDRVRASFLEQAASQPERFAVIDAGRDPNAVQAEMLAAVLGLIEHKFS